MASSHAMEFLAARCRVAVAASKLSSTDVATINVLLGNIINTTTTRKIHATTARHYAEDYIHAEHMYNLPSMKQRKVKMFIAVFGSLFFGAAVPIWAVRFQLKKQGPGPTLDTKSTTEYPDKLT
ncbi:hypothetical protein CY35_06G069000 [Sphagnum magellanicum]|nr:hypothetical protein CY35_06G069000 [Sphagnum magellanicum]